MAKKESTKEKSEFTGKWILDTTLEIIDDYDSLTIRGLHYLLVAKGMTNDVNHYKKVVSVMGTARWNGDVRFDAFLDHERETIGSTDYHATNVDDTADNAKRQIKAWATSYSKNRWENQPYYPEVFIEKKTLQGIFEGPCQEYDIALNPCKGYPSLTFLDNAKDRFQEAINAGKQPIILYFGDYDCSGEDIPRSIKENLSRMGVDVEVRVIALTKDQVIKWKLPPAPTKSTDSRGANWDGLGQVELDAVNPKKLVKLCEDAINEILDADLYRNLMWQQENETKQFKRILKRDFKSLLD